MINEGDVDVLSNEITTARPTTVTLTLPTVEEIRDVLTNALSVEIVAVGTPYDMSLNDCNESSEERRSKESEETMIPEWMNRLND